MASRPVDYGNPLGKCDLHHAILSKASVRGMPDSEKAKIHDPRNLLKVEHNVHLTRVIPEGREAALLLYRIYGREAVLEWWRGINFKHRPFELP